MNKMAACKGKRAVQNTARTVIAFDAISAKIGHAAFVRAVKSNDFKRSISMTVKELGELRRRLRPDKNAISRIYGC